MLQAARQTFDQNFTADTNHEVLLASYARHCWSGRPRAANLNGLWPVGAAA
jgi:hypothetical protein